MPTIDELREQASAKDRKLAEENKGLKRQLQKALDALEHARSATPPPRSPTPKGAVRTDHARVFVGDLHGYYQDCDAVAALLADLKIIQPAIICLLGDMLDCGGFLAQHQTLGFVAEGEYTYEQDVAAVNDFLTRLQTTCPDAQITYIEGNHEHRIEKWCMTQALRHTRDARMLYDHFGPAAVLKLADRGIRFVAQSDFVDGASIRGTARYGQNGIDVYATHGTTSCKHAAAKHLEKFAANVVFGHTHRDDGRVSNTVERARIGAWSPGCLCQRVRLWNHNQPDEWSTGYHLQLVSKSGLFQTLNVKLIGKQSLLHSLLSK